MKAFVTLIALLLAGASHAALPAVPLRHSQQFTVIDTRSPESIFVPLKSSSGAALIKLDADVLLLSAGRIKEALISELGLGPEHAGRIRLLLYKALTPNDLI